MNRTHAASAALLLALTTISAISIAQPNTREGVTQPLPDLGAEPPLPASSAPLPADMKPRIRPQLKPRMKSDELKLDPHPEQRPEMSPGMQPNSQKPLRTDAPTRRNN